MKTDKKVAHFLLLISLLGGAFSIFFLPPAATEVIFFLFIVFFWFDKRNYLWLAFLLIVLDCPGGLFSLGDSSARFVMPIFSAAKGYSLSFADLFIIVAFIKALKNKRKGKLDKYFLFANESSFLIFTFIILIIISFAIGMSKQSFTYSLDYLVELTLLFSVPVLMPKIEDFTKLLMIIAPYAILAVLLQVVEIILGFQIIHLFNPAMIAYQGVFNSAGDTPVDMIRPIELCYTALLIIILGLSIIRLKKVPINRVFILVTIALSVISLLMTGTRTWFLGMIAGVLYYFIKLKAINKTTIVTLLIPGIMIIIASFYIGVVGGQISDAVGRYGTLELLFGGDQTAGGTLIRVTERGPRVMDEFFQSTIIFGDALSDRFYEFGDEHVGYQNILLNAGFFGCLIFVFFLYRLYVVPFNVQRTLNSQNPYKDILKISFMGLICLLVINSGVQVIGFTIGPLKMLFLAIIVAFISSATFASRESEIMIRESNKKYLLSKKIAQEVK